MIQVICCSSLLSVPGRAGAFSRDFTTSLARECRAFSGALKIEKLKALLIPGPEGAVDTNDWCINAEMSILRFSRYVAHTNSQVITLARNLDRPTCINMTSQLKPRRFS